MGVACSCFGKNQGDRGQAAGSHGFKSPFLQNVVKKIKSIFDESQAENAATSGGSTNEARVAATSTTSATAARGAISMQRVVPTHQPNPPVNNRISSNSESRRSGQQCQSLNKATAEAGNVVPIQRKSNVWKGSKSVAKRTAEARVKQLVNSSSSESFKDCVEIFPSSDDEDVCPTCLEEYDEENPKITTNCNHHFHLSCIFEWMEQSASCPVCGKVMVFEQMS